MTERTSEILMFQVGARVFAAEVYDVVRIGSVRETAADELVEDSVLGRPLARSRGLVIAVDGERTETLAVDQVLGVRTVPEDALQPIPAFAAACLQSAAVTGFVMLDEAPTLLVDLSTLLRERRPPRADAERT